MRVIVFFDLPTETAEQRRNYRQFRKVLIKNGFFMLQESVYCRLVLNPTVQQSVFDVINRQRPPQGLVQVLAVTERQFSNMQCITGASSSDVLNNEKKVVII